MEENASDNNWLLRPGCSSMQKDAVGTEPLDLQIVWITWRRPASPAMQNRIDIDRALSYAILRGIGEGLRALLSERADLPLSFKEEIEQFRKLEDQAPSAEISSKSKYRSLELLCRHQAGLACHQNTRAELENMAREYQQMADLVEADQ